MVGSIFYPFLGAFDVKTAKIETELSSIFTDNYFDLLLDLSLLMLKFQLSTHSTHHFPSLQGSLFTQERAYKHLCSSLCF